MQCVHLSFGALVLVASASCVPQLPSRGAVDLREVDTKVVHFAFDAPRGGICPGQPVDLDIELVADEDGHPTHLFQKRQEIDDAIFDLRQIHLSSAQGKFDPNGRFTPDPDPRVSAQTGFVFFVNVPRGPTFMARFPPVYECESSFGRDGQAGTEGDPGNDALVEDLNPLAAKSDNPDVGATGFTGGQGWAGSEGPRYTVYVTWVRTPDYTKLLAARAEGDIEGFTLRSPGNALSLVARGGSGGQGGRGGQGATSMARITAPSDVPHRGKRRVIVAPSVNGGLGGQGGVGGAGGHGGSIHVVLDERYPDLGRWVSADAGGGVGGRGGRGGAGGDTSTNKSGVRETSAYRGKPGPSGSDGPSGGAGETSFEHGDVLAKFQNLGAIVPLGAD